MAYYLVTAVPNKELLENLKEKLKQKSFQHLRPFGKALTYSLENARIDNNTAVWEEEDYCTPPLREEREAVLDNFFSNIEVEKVNREEGWERIKNLPFLFSK